MAASPALPLLLLLLLAALLVAATDAAPAGRLKAEALCLRTTDVASCQSMIRDTSDVRLEATPDTRSLVESFIGNLLLSVRQAKSNAAKVVEVEQKKTPRYKCLENCIKIFNAVSDTLEPPAAGGVKVPEEERLLAIHRNFTLLLRGSPGQPRLHPPLCKTCCDNDACRWGSDQAEYRVYEQFGELWSELDFADAALEELYPGTGTATTTTTSPATGSTADKTSTDDNCTPPPSAPNVDTAPAPPVTTYD